VTRQNRSPGPIADRTFDSGFKIAALAGVACVGLLFSTGRLSFDGADVLFTLILFPVYLLSAATLLGVWLGYETDESNLKRETGEVEAESSER
jgi:hypothetical protein